MNVNIEIAGATLLGMFGARNLFHQSWDAE
jgi:hypothetical protein